MLALPRPHTQPLYLRLEWLRPNSQPSTLSLGEQEGGCPANPWRESGVQVSQNMPRRVLPHPAVLRPAPGVDLCSAP